MNLIKKIFEDEEILLIDKPSGITVNRADTTKDEETVQDYAEKETGIRGENDDFHKRAGIVHRIDKETSGLLIIAKTNESFVELQRQFRERIVEKEYIALVHGVVEQDEGEIRVPVGRLPWNRKRFGVLAGGKDAITSFRVKERFSDLTLLELFPKTGRTHQIRVHLKYINHPIFGDMLYAGRKTSRNDRKKLQRFFLHAYKISFLHPKSGEKLTFSSNLPEELSKLLESLRG